MLHRMKLYVDSERVGWGWSQVKDIGKKKKFTQKFLEIYLGLRHPGFPSQKPTTATNKQKCLSNDTTVCLQHY